MHACAHMHAHRAENEEYQELNEARGAWVA